MWKANMLSLTSNEDEVGEAVRDFFRPGYAVSWKWDLVGMRSEDGYVVFGASIGVKSGIEYLVHEMAHFVEIDEARCRQDTWGLRWPQKFVCGHSVCEPQTLQMTRRELRVCALQSNFLAAFGVRHRIRELTDSLIHLPDQWLVPAHGDEGKKLWYARQAVAYARAPIFSFESFKRIWHRRASGG